MNDISKKIAELQNKKEALEQKILEIKRTNTQKISGALACMSGIENIDPYILIGLVHKTVTSNKLTEQEQEGLLKSGKNFCRKYKAQITALASRATESKSHHKEPITTSARTEKAGS